MAIEIETQAKEAYTWCATLHDGTQVPEYDESRPDGRGFGEVDKSQIKHLHLLLPSGVHAHVATIPDGAEPVFLRRGKIEISLSTEKEVGRVRIHCIGWKKEDGGSYLFVFEDGSSLLSSDFYAV